MRLIAHRGASGVAPENTLPAFEEAIRAGADAVEFDVRLTADGSVVVMHDDDVSRTTDGEGSVSKLSAAQLRALDAAARHPTWGVPEKVPTLQEVLALIGDRVPVVIELKGALDGQRYISAALVAEAIAPMIASIERVLVSSFEPQATEALRRLLPSVPTAVTSFHGVDPTWALELAMQRGDIECHIPRAVVTPGFVARAHDVGIAVLCWTVNEPDDVRTMRAMGMDGIFTDHPAAARAALS